MKIAGIRRAQEPARLSSAQLVLAIISVAAVFVLLALGVWQIERRTWKLALIDRVEARIHAAPDPMPSARSWFAVNAAEDEYRHVRVTGRFLHEREAAVMAVTELGAGFWVVTPLRMAGGATVLVNRGFVPPERRDPAGRREGNPEGTVTVTGLLRMTEPRGAFLRTNDPAADRWYSRDVEAIAAARGLEHAAPFFIDADATANPGGNPVGGLTVVRFHNNHLIYALTWFAMASMLAAALLSVARDRCGKVTRDNPVRNLPGGAQTFPRKNGSDAEAVVESA